MIFIKDAVFFCAPRHGKTGGSSKTLKVIRTAEVGTPVLLPSKAPPTLAGQRMAENLQVQFDDAVFAYTTGDYAAAVAGFEAVLAVEPEHFEARLSLGMAFYRQENYAAAIEEGHKAEAINTNEQRVHTNLSLAYMKRGNKETAEHHGLQAKIAGWKADPEATAAAEGGGDLKMAEPKLENIKLPTKFPEQPWKKKKD